MLLFVGRPADGSVYSEKAGREESAPKSQLPTSTPFEVRKEAFAGDRYWRGCSGIGCVSSPGHVFIAVGQEPRTTLHLPLTGRTASARSRVPVAAIASHASAELATGKKANQLGKDALAFVHPLILAVGQDACSHFEPQQAQNAHNVLGLNRLRGQSAAFTGQ